LRTAAERKSGGNALRKHAIEKTGLRRIAIACVLLATSAMPALAQSSPTLADAFKTIASKKMVDLTHTFGVGTPVWSGFGQATMTAASDPKTHEPYTIEKHGFRTTYYSMVGQYGTHVDPPAHFDANGMTMDKIPLDQMIMPLVVFDDTKYFTTDENHALTVDDIKEWEKENGDVPKGAFAALRTDMYKDWDANPERFKRFPFPAWTLDAVKYLFETRGVTAIGHEGLDTDITQTMDSETWILKSGHYQIEVMANLDQVPATGAVIVVTWPKVENGFGFPARAFAILP
jgi:kynurenine formamidase